MNFIKKLFFLLKRSNGAMISLPIYQIWAIVAFGQAVLSIDQQSGPHLRSVFMVNG